MEQIRLIVRADDMGACHAVNEACIRCYREGILRSVEVLVLAPWFPEAVKMLNENPGLDAGVHVAVTSEWDACRWRPLTYAPSLVDDNGYCPARNGEVGKPGSGFLGMSFKLDEVERELRAQIEMARKHIKNLTHLSTHMHALEGTDQLKALVHRLAREYALPIEVPGWQWMGFAGEEQKSTAEEKQSVMAQKLEALTPGLWLFLEHPGLDGPELRAIGHEGYRNVAEDREGVTRMFTSEKIKEIIQRRKISLVSYGEALKQR